MVSYHSVKFASDPIKAGSPQYYTQLYWPEAFAVFEYLRGPVLAWDLGYTIRKLLEILT